MPYAEFVYALTFVLLVCCWVISDLSTRSKLILTGLYLACWGASWVSGLAGALGQCLLALVLCGLTFGLDSLIRR